MQKRKKEVYILDKQEKDRAKKKGHHNKVIKIKCFVFADSVSFCDDTTKTFLIIQKKVCLAALSFNA